MSNKVVDAFTALLVVTLFIATVELYILIVTRLIKNGRKVSDTRDAGSRNLTEQQQSDNVTHSNTYVYKYMLS